MVEIQIEYQGELRCAAVHGPSDCALRTDAPVDNHGKGESFSPTDLLATSLGACMLTIMGIVAEREGLDVSGARVRVVKSMAADPQRRVGRLELLFQVPGRFTDEARAQLEQAAHTCPVALSLSERIEVSTRFEWEAAPVS